MEERSESERRLLIGGTSWLAATVLLVVFLVPVQRTFHFGHMSGEALRFVPIWKAGSGELDWVILAGELTVGLLVGLAGWFVAGGERDRLRS